MASIWCLALFACMLVVGRAFEIEDQGPNLTAYKAEKEAAQAEAEEKAAKERKMAAVKKVVSMLEELRTQVLAEGEEEAKTYNTFACFCKDQTSDKGKAIEEGEDSKTDFIAKIEKSAERREELDKEMAKIEKDIEKLEKKMKKAEKKREEEMEEYTKNEADLSAALTGLEGAIKELKAAKTKASFVQMQAVSKKVQQALLMADALGLPSTVRVQHSMAVFLQHTAGGDVPTKDYEFQSGDIIDTLEGLLGDFRDEKVAVDKEEVEAVADHDTFMQEKSNEVKAKNVELDGAKKEKNKKMEEMSLQNSELSIISAALLDDQQYLTQLSEMCHKRALTWDQRSKVRKGEINALSTAISIMEEKVKEAISGKSARFAQQRVTLRRAEAVATNEASMNSIEAATEADEAGKPAINFLQRLRVQRAFPDADGRQAVINLLRTKSQELRSTSLSSLAMTLSADKFAKIKTLIQAMIEKMLAEAAAEANQKGWCDKGMNDAKQKRDYAAEDIEGLNGNMATLESNRDELLEKLGVLPKEIDALKAAMKTAKSDRKKEKSENKATVEEATAGLEAVQEATKILDRFYKTAAKSEVDLSLMVVKAKLVASGAAPAPAYEPEAPPPAVDVAGDMPDAGFDSGEAYGGAQGGKEGVLGMLEVIASDFERTISETEEAEDEAAMENLKFMTESGKSLAEKEMEEGELKKQKDDVLQSLEDDKESFDDKVKTLKGAIAELLELKKACVDTGMTYEERVAAREAEIEALKKALCIFDNFEKYGSEGSPGASC